MRKIVHGCYCFLSPFNSLAHTCVNSFNSNTYLSLHKHCHNLLGLFKWRFLTRSRTAHCAAYIQAQHYSHLEREDNTDQEWKRPVTKYIQFSKKWSCQKDMGNKSEDCQVTGDAESAFAKQRGWTGREDAGLSSSAYSCANNSKYLF